MYLKKKIDIISILECDVSLSTLATKQKVVMDIDLDSSSEWIKEITGQIIVLLFLTYFSFFSSLSLKHKETLMK